MRNKDFYISKNEKIMQSLIDKHDAGDGKKNFVKDGIVNPEVWFSLSPEKEKILFLLKESYEKDKNIKRISDLTKWICKEKCTEICDKNFECEKCGADGKTFNPIAEWVYGINCICEGKEAEYDSYLGVAHKDYINQRDELLKSIAVINLKKSDGINVSNNDDLYYAAAADKEELITQIELINPSLIICGSTYGMLRCLYTDMETLTDIKNGACIYNGRKIIATYHPSNPGSGKMKYDNVMKLYKSLLK